MQGEATIINLIESANLVLATAQSAVYRLFRFWRLSISHTIISLNSTMVLTWAVNLVIAGRPVLLGMRGRPLDRLTRRGSLVCTSGGL